VFLKKLLTALASKILRRNTQWFGTSRCQDGWTCDRDIKDIQVIVNAFGDGHFGFLVYARA